MKINKNGSHCRKGFAHIFFSAFLKGYSTNDEASEASLPRQSGRQSQRQRGANNSSSNIISDIKFPIFAALYYLNKAIKGARPAPKCRQTTAKIALIDINEE